MLELCQQRGQQHVVTESVVRADNQNSTNGADRLWSDYGFERICHRCGAQLRINEVERDCRRCLSSMSKRLESLSIKSPVLISHRAQQSEGIMTDTLNHDPVVLNTETYKVLVEIEVVVERVVARSDDDPHE